MPIDKKILIQIAVGAVSAFVGSLLIELYRTRKRRSSSNGTVVHL